ncbi:MAG TPA: HEAT repeat domain-containing protein [Gemmatimonadaceae bacterium]
MNFAWLPDAALRGALLLAVAFAIARLLRSQPAATRHVLWAGALAGVLAMPLLSTIAPLRIALPFPSSVSTLATGDVEPSTPWRSVTRQPNETAIAPVSRHERAATVPVPPGADVSAAAPSSLVPAWLAGLTPAGIALAIWVAGATLLALRLVVGFLALRRIRHRARPLDNPAVRDLVAACAERMGAHATPPLLVSNAVAMPCTAGWLRPVVLLPDECLDWDPQRLEIVLLHELGHIRRMDIVPHLAGEVARVVYWFNPLVWLATARLRAEAESATDESVVRAGMRPSDYAGHLLDIVRQARPAWHPVPVLPLARRSEFEGRILSILDADPRRLPTARRAASVMALVGVLSLGVASMGSAVNRGAFGDEQTARDDSASLITGIETRERDDAADQPGRATENVQEGDDGDHTGTGAADGDRASRAARAQASDRGAAVSALAAALRDPVAAVRAAAAEALGNARDSVAVRALMELLRTDPSAPVRRSAAWSLGEIEDPAAIPALAEALVRDRDREVRKNAAQALGQIERPQATPALVQALERDGEVAVRLAAAEALAEIEDPSSIDALIRAVDRDTDPEVRRAVIEAIDNLEDARAVAAVSRALRDDNAEVRYAAADALGSMDDRAAVPALVAAARDPNAEVRRAVIDALGNLGDRRAEPVFAAALGDSDVEVRRAAAQASGNLEHVRTAPPELLRAMNDADAEVRHNVAHALGSIEDPAAIPVLIARIGDGNVDVRRAVVDALNEFDDPAVTEALRTALRDSDPEVRESAARALGNRSRSR